MEIKAVKGWMFQLHLSFKSGLKMKPIPRGQHGENAPFEPDILNCSVMNINLYSALIFSNELGSCIAKRGISKLILLGISCRNALSEIQLLLSVFCNFSLSLSLFQMRMCSSKRVLASGMRQIWTCPTRGNLTTPMTVG